MLPQPLNGHVVLRAFKIAPLLDENNRIPSDRPSTGA